MNDRPATDVLMAASNVGYAVRGQQILDAVSLELHKNEIVTLIGPNGAGKTTALKAILGLANYEGDLKVLGKSPAKDRAAQYSRGGLSANAFWDFRAQPYF